MHIFASVDDLVELRLHCSHICRTRKPSGRLGSTLWATARFWSPEPALLAVEKVRWLPRSALLLCWPVETFWCLMCCCFESCRLGWLSTSVEHQMLPKCMIQESRVARHLHKAAVVYLRRPMVHSWRVRPWRPTWTSPLSTASPPWLLTDISHSPARKAVPIPPNLSTLLHHQLKCPAALLQQALATLLRRCPTSHLCISLLS